MRTRTILLTLCAFLILASAADAVRISQPGSSANLTAPGPIGGTTSDTGQFTKLAVGASVPGLPTNVGDESISSIFSFTNGTANDCFNTATYSICAPSATGRLTLNVPNTTQGVFVVQGTGTIGGWSSATGLFGQIGITIANDTAKMVSMARMPLNFPIAAVAATTTTQWGESKVVKALTVENVVFNVGAFTCSVNPAISLFDCSATVGTCTPVSTLATSGTLTGIGSTNAATTPQANVAAGEYIAAEFTAGTCTVFNGSVQAMARPQ